MSAKSRLSSALLVITLICLLGCANREEPPAASAEPEPTPEIFRAQFETSKGDFVVEVSRQWAPQGADRFYELVRDRFFDGCRFFRVVPRFAVQFGIHGDPSVSRLWSQLRIPDDPVKESNRKGTLSYAKTGPATRTTQVFINLADNKQLDGMGFAPFGRVISGMEVIEEFYRGYGDVAPRGHGPSQDRIELEGKEYLERHFPRLDYIKRATILP